MIQFNLLPDVKLQYVKARRTKQTVIMTSILISAASLALFAILFSVVNFAQKTHMSHLDKDIAASKNQLKAKPDLEKILTIQNQLNSLTDLHNKKPVTSRTFSYIQQLTPQNVAIAAFTVNFKDQTIKIEGTADTLASVNTFTDTLKFTNYVVNTGSTQQADAKDLPLAFSEVVLKEFSIANKNISQAKAKPASYTITLKYKSDIFDSSKDVKLQVANKITTRSETEKPSAVFEQNTNQPAGGTN